MVGTLIRKADFWAGLGAFAWAVVAFLWEPRLNDLVSFEAALAFSFAAFGRLGIGVRAAAAGNRRSGDGVPEAEVDDPTSPEGVPRGLASAEVMVVLGAASWLGVWALVGAPLWASLVVVLAAALLLGTFRVVRWARALHWVPVLALLLTGCAGLGGPGLASVVGRIDVGRAIECAKQPTAEDKARCLGVSLLTDGLNIALDQAAHWGEKALTAASGAGADDLSDRDRRNIAKKADLALDMLGAEIARAQEQP